LRRDVDIAAAGNRSTPAAKKRSWCVMETLIWLGITVAVLLLVWAAAPYHARMVENRDAPNVENWD
jgi:hypothetical protein